MTLKFNPKRLAFEEVSDKEIIFKESDLKHDNKKIVRLTEKYIGWHGSTPFVEFDENFVQMPLTRTKLTIPREHTTRMSYLAWWSGFIAGARGQANLKNFLIAIIILVILTAGAVYMFNNENKQAISSMAGNFTIFRGEILNALGSTIQNQTAPVV